MDSEVYKEYKVVCVDDEEEVLSVLGPALEEGGFSVATFTDPQEALAYLNTHAREVALIVSDFKMPGMDAFALKKSISAQEIPFAILTAYWNKEMAAEGMALGVRSFFEKPFDLKVILEMVESLAIPRIESLEGDREMASEFLEESFGMLEEMEDLILDLETGRETEECLNKYFRLLHTIKGTANCVGLLKLGAFAHKYEDFVGNVREGKVVLNTRVISVLLLGLDSLSNIYATLRVRPVDHVLDTGPMEEEFLSQVQEATSPGSAEANGEELTFHHKAKDPGPKKAEEASQKDEKMQVPLGMLDEFMMESGELTVVRNTIIKTIRGLEGEFQNNEEFSKLSELMLDLNAITSGIQRKISDMRKVQVKQVFRPFSRLVRDLSKGLNKEVALEVVGEELFVDHVLAKAMSSVLVHILRNSVDHGIEPEEERLELGKDKKGTIRLSVVENGESIVITIADDGKGMDPEIIKGKGLEKGLVSESDLEYMHEADILGLIFEPGFSTAKTVSDVSGRGVGMDMVKSTVESLDGQVLLESEVGRGSTFTMTLPLPKSVLIINSLLVTSRGASFAFPINEVKEVILIEDESTRERVEVIDGNQILRYHEGLVPLLSLSEVLQLGKPETQENIKNIVVLADKHLTVGLVVDEIVDFEEVVCKRLNTSFFCDELYYGASLLGNGDIALVISTVGVAKLVELDGKQKFRKRKVEKSVLDESQSYLQFMARNGKRYACGLEHVGRMIRIDSKDIKPCGEQMVLNYGGRPLPVIDPVRHMKGEETPREISGGLFVVVVNLGKTTFGLLVETVVDIFETRGEANRDTINDPAVEGLVFLGGHTLCVLNLSHIVSAGGIRLSDRAQERAA